MNSLDNQQQASITLRIAEGIFSEHRLGKVQEFIQHSISSFAKQYYVLGSWDKSTFTAEFCDISEKELKQLGEQIEAVLANARLFCEDTPLGINIASCVTHEMK